MIIAMFKISFNLCSGFAAFMINHMTWETDDFESFLEVDVKLNLTLEVVTIPLKIMIITWVVAQLFAFFWGGERCFHILHWAQLTLLRLIFGSIIGSVCCALFSIISLLH